MKDNSESYQFSFLRPDQKELIVALRKHSYESYFGKQVSLQGLEWNLTDEQSTHLGFFKDGELVSCLRLSVFQNMDRLEGCTLFKTPSSLTLPIAVLARAATHSDHGNAKLHGRLRAIALQLCLFQKIFAVLGTLEERSSRLSTLTKFGYQILDRKESWPGSYLQNQGAVVLIGLCSEEEIRQATKEMHEKIYQDFAGPYPELFQI